MSFSLVSIEFVQVVIRLRTKLDERNFNNATIQLIEV